MLPAFPFGHGLLFGESFALDTVFLAPADAEKNSCVLRFSVSNPVSTPFRKPQSEVLQVYVKRFGRPFKELHLFFRLPELAPGDVADGSVVLAGVWPPTWWSAEAGWWLPSGGDSELYVGFSLAGARKVEVPSTGVCKGSWAGRSGEEEGSFNQWRARVKAVAETRVRRGSVDQVQRSSPVTTIFS